VLETLERARQAAVHRELLSFEKRLAAFEAFEEGQPGLIDAVTATRVRQVREGIRQAIERQPSPLERLR
jgi:hypothetical protein